MSAAASPHYRQDELSEMDKQLRKFLDEHFLSQLLNLNEINPKVLVVFSGGNAVGKSTISKKIEHDLRGLVVENDAIKRTLISFKSELAENRDELNKLTWQYSMGLYPRLHTFTKNGLLVRDGVIDWYFDRILPFFEKSGYRLFIVGFDISDVKAIELIRTRGDTPTVKEERFYKIMQDHKIHQARFRKLYRPNIVLHDENLFDHEVVIDKLRDFIQE